MLLDIAYRSSESKSITIAMSSYLKRIIGCFDTTLEIFKLFFSLDTWTLVLICPIAYFKRHWAWNFWTNFCIGHLDTQFEIVRVSFLLRTLGHWPWNFQALSFFGHLDAWTLGLNWKFWTLFCIGHLDTQFEIVKVSFLLWTLGHRPWNFQALSFFGHLDT